MKEQQQWGYIIILQKGIGYDPERDQKNPWISVHNVDFWNFEFLSTIRDASKAWNKCTQLWLDNYM